MVPNLTVVCTCANIIYILHGCTYPIAISVFLCLFFLKQYTNSMMTAITDIAVTMITTMITTMIPTVIPVEIPT